MKCRSCKNDLKFEVIDLKNAPLSNSYLLPKELNLPEIYYPLKVFICHKCKLFQTTENLSSKYIFNDTYHYLSSYSSFYVEQCEFFVKKLIKKYKLNKDTFIIEIASNDGYLLNIFNKFKIPNLGIEPTLRSANIAKRKKIKVINSFFNLDLAKKLSKKKVLADVIIAFNVLAHVPNINNFLSSFPKILKPNGIVVFEFPHVLNLIKHNQFDTIYHEHYSYLSIIFLKNKLFDYNLEIFKIETLESHGGSLRVFVKKKSFKEFKIESSVQQIIREENKYKINSLSTFKIFRNNINNIRDSLLSLLYKLKKNNQIVIAYGAAAKGNTILNYFNINSDLIKYVVDKNIYKQGKFLPGSHIPIKDPKIIIKDKPKFIFILPWNIKDEIIKDLEYVRRWNCKFITAIPKLKVF
jgi:SAM-dependent methyltransferase